MKKCNERNVPTKKRSKKLNFKMKFCFLMASFMLFQLSANSVMSQKKMDFEYENVSLKRVLKEIKSQTGYRFFYNVKEIDDNQKTSIDANGETIHEVMMKLSTKVNFDFKINDNQIVLTRKITTSSLNQEREIKGTVKDQDGQSLPGANVLVKGTSTGTQTDLDGNFSISVPEGNETLVISYIGFKSKEINISSTDFVEVVLEESASQLTETVVVGSRNPNRTATETATPVDVIDMAEIVTQSGKIEINEILNFVAPSFNATKQSGTDGADHIDPISLRGLGPDQTLVLINGKRRHQSSLVNLFGTRARGNTGTDLNAIPTTAIERIEILRDGAAAQYGSDAIAGVINIVLKKKAGVEGFVSYGAYKTDTGADLPDGTPNTDGNRLDLAGDGNTFGEDKGFDGQTIKVGFNYGVALGEKGFANFTTEYLNKQKTLRPGFGFRKGFGEAAIEGFNFMANAGYNLSENTELYAFGGRNYRDTDAFAFTRNVPGNRVVVDIYPDGFTPRITSIIVDNAATVGLRSESSGGWKSDVSYTYGSNNFHYFIKGTLNASLQENSPTDFDAGGHSLSQNVLNLDFSKYYDDVLSGMNLAFGAEYRTENFTIFAGEEGSYGLFDVNGVIQTSGDQVIPVDPITGETRPGGSQGFGGYKPADEKDRSRSNFSIYADSEFDISESFLISAAARFENYSDFGGTLNGKLAMRVKASDNFNIRGSVSTGFRAPSLAQIYYGLTFQAFVDGQLQESLLSDNTSRVTRSFGIPELSEEKSVNASLGFTTTIGNLTATLDGYLINVNDRIVLTGRFPADQIPGVSNAQFFANGVDTQTTGVDLVLAWKKRFDDGSISATLSGNLNSMEIKSINNGSLDQDTFFGPVDRAILIASAPDSKFGLNLGYSKKKFTAGISATRFGGVILKNSPDTEDVYTPKIVTDLTLSHDLGSSLNLAIGANNLFNVYPDQQDDGETGGYWDSVQMGFGGAYFYSRLAFNF